MRDLWEDYEERGREKSKTGTASSRMYLFKDHMFHSIIFQAIESGGMTPTAEAIILYQTAPQQSVILTVGTPVAETLITRRGVGTPLITALAMIASTSGPSNRSGHRVKTVRL